MSGTIGVGGGTGSTGNGGTVTVNLAGSVNTYGSGAHAIFAQSIGGGGGAAGNVDRGLKNYFNVGVGLAFGQGGGNGGDGAAVTVNSSADLFTLGNGANGIFAQSIGGGGGVAGSLGDDLPILNVQNFAGSVGGTGSGNIVHVTQSGNITTLGDAADGVFAQSAGGQQVGKAVTVTLAKGNILAYGAESNGIFAQSTGLGGRDNITVNIDNVDSIVMGGTGTGAGVRFADGVVNTLNNHGLVYAAGGIAGTAIVGGAGQEIINNYGRVNGSVDLGGGANVFDNKTGALFESGTQVNVGAAGTFNNSGTLSVGGGGAIGTTTVTGNFTQSGAPKWLVDIGNIGVSDTLAVSGHAQLGTSTTTVDLQELTLPTGSGSYTLLSAAQGGLAGANFRFGTMYGAMPLGQTFDFATSDTAVQLTLLPSTGTFRWTGANGGNWTTPFVNGVSNWSREGDSDYVYGTPGQASDVVVANAGTAVMGADFSINSLKFGGVGAGHTLAGGNTLTLIGTGGRGLIVDPGSMPTTVSADLILGGDQSWVNDSRLTVNGQTITGPGKNLTIDGSGATTISAAIQTGTGSVIKTGSGVLVMNGANTYAGGTTINGGTLVADLSNLPGDIRDNAILLFGQPGGFTFANNISGTGAVIKQGGGTLTLTGNNSFTGGTSVLASTLIGNTSSLPGDIVNNGAIVFDQGAAGTYAGSMTGGGTLAKVGSGSLTLTGTNSFSGGTTVFEGTLVGNSSSLQGQIVNHTAVVFDQARTGTYAGAMTGEGSFIKQGAGVLTLGGSNSFTGGTAVLEGTLVGNTSSLPGNILDSAAVIFDQGQTGLYSGIIGGSGTLTKQGNGSLILDNDSSLFAGSTTVSAGQLVVNGALGGTRLILQSGTLLGGNGFVPATTVQDGATLAPGNSIGTIRVMGAIRFDPGSAYRVETDSTGRSDLTLSADALTLGGGTVDVRAAGSTGYRAITRYSIFGAKGGVSGVFGAVTSDLTYLDPSLQYDARNVYLTLRRNDIDFRSVGTTGNRSAVAGVLNRLVGSATDAMADVVNNVYGLTSSQAVDAIGSMTGMIHQQVARSGLDNARTFVGANVRRLELVGTDDGHSEPVARLATNTPDVVAAPAPDETNYGFWFTGLQGGTNYRGNSSDAAANSLNNGMVVGFDAAIGDRITVGVSGGNASPSVSLEGTNDQASTRGMLQGAVYGRYAQKHSRVDAVVGLSGYETDTIRMVTDGAAKVNARASYQTQSLAAHFEYGYTFNIGRTVDVAPYGGAQLGRLHVDGFNETGAGVLGLTASERDVFSRRLLAGSTVGKLFRTGFGALRLEGRAAWTHEFTLVPDLALQFQGDSWTRGFNLTLPDQLRDGAILGAALRADTRGNFRFFVDFNGETSHAEKAWQGNLGVTKRW